MCVGGGGRGESKENFADITPRSRGGEENSGLKIGRGWELGGGEGRRGPRPHPHLTFGVIFFNVNYIGGTCWQSNL